MKKIFTLMLVAIGLSFAVTAQNREVRYNNDDKYRKQQESDYRNKNNRHQSKDYGYNSRRERNDDYDRMNRDYDSRIDGYRKDRSMDRYERNRQVEEAERERQEKTRAFGTGVVVGGLAAIVLGVLIGSAGH